MVDTKEQYETVCAYLQSVRKEQRTAFTYT